VKGELAFAERIHEVIMGEVENSTGFEQTKWEASVELNIYI
jgi:hypothetical protein